MHNICDYIASETGLSKGRIKHAMNCGALQVKKGKGKIQRLRRSSSGLASGSQIWLYYDETVLALAPAKPSLIKDFNRYSIWFKPPGLLSQGSQWGDHCSLIRQIELNFNGQRKVFLIHRLDQAACGLVMLAHQKTTAAKLSRMFVERAVEKVYHVRVEGLIRPDEGVIDKPIDGKSAITRYRKLHEPVNSTRDAETTLLEVTIETGRKHQIRRHLSSLGHAVVGDALYGVKSKNGLHLAATKLDYKCPEQGRDICVQLSEADIEPYWM